MGLSRGTTLGGYEILAPLGAGGMGEVYRAKDARLDREVAIKVLPDLFSRDPERVARFQREAKVLASLNHPNIAAVYGFESVGAGDIPRSGSPPGAGGQSEAALHFLVMELVEGNTLAERLKTGVLPVADTLDVAKQMAEALEAAHERGIIHRDLKPANVKVTPEGKVKVLDFGLAKAMAVGTDASQTEVANSPTITADFTRPGMVMGTAAYMSPEQTRGKPLDKRTDIWSFGCVVYELLTGDRLFDGETTSDAIGAILHKEPDWSALPVDTPPTVQLLLRRCLAKDRNQRLRDVGDARIELENAISDPTSSSLRFADSALAAEDRRGARRGRVGVRLLWAIVLLALGAATAWVIKPSRSPLGRIVSQIPAPPDGRILFTGDTAGPAVVSPDGKMLAFVAQELGKRQRIWVRSLDRNESRPLRGTQTATFPFWSADSRSLGFFTSTHLKRVDLASGTTQTVCDVVGGRGGTWLKDGTIVFSPSYQVGLSRVSASGGEPKPITKLDADQHTSHRWPARVGDGNHFLFSAINHDLSKSQNAAIYLGSLDGTPPVKLIASLLNAEYALGQLLFVRDNVLMAAALDVDSGIVSGDPVAVVSGVSPDLSTWRAAFSASSAGVLAYHGVGSSADDDDGSNNPSLGTGAEANVSVWYDREGRPTGQVAEGVSQIDLRVAPGGGRMAISVISVISDQEFGIDLWIYHQHGQAPQRVTSMPFAEAMPVWSPDGTELAFAYMFGGDGQDAIYRKRIGGGIEHKLVEAPGDLQIWPTDWSSDGKYLIYTTGRRVGGTNLDIHVLPLDGGDAFPYVATSAEERGGRVSPNGKWLAYESGTSSGWDVYVIPFTPDRGVADGNGGSTAPPEEKWQISVGGGSAPCWNSDGKELFYISADAELIAVAVETEGDHFVAGTTTKLFQTAFEPGKSFDVSPDGLEFVFNEVSVNVDTPISLIVNWNEGLDP